MRSATGADAPTAPHARKQSASDSEVTPLPAGSGGAPTAFFVATESELDQRDSACSSTYGIRSMEEALERVNIAEAGVAGGEASGVSDLVLGNRRRSTIETVRAGKSAEKAGKESPARSTGSSPEERARRPFRIDTVSQPMTPISFTSPMPGSSMPNSPKSMSLRHFDDDCSQAVSSGDEDEEQPGGGEYEGTAAPQFIMPSITMPSRRPFTKRGKELGKLKVLLAGPSGSGKTSLLKSIVQVCEDIVHVDSLSTSISTTMKEEGKSRSRSRSQRTSVRSKSTSTVTEIFASTKAYPSWWSELEDSSFLKRRRSIEESILERNLCFVDTPAYDKGTSLLEGMEQTLKYMEGQMTKSLSLENLEDSELLSILSGNGSFQVDVVLYLIMHDIKPSDLEFIRQLTQLTNVVPLLAKADTIPEEEKATLKAAAQEQLAAANVMLFTFPSNDTGVVPPFTVCSSLSHDLEDMDASLLMQPDYIQPLLPSDLSHLLDLLFDKENFSFLKHSAAKKLLSWRKGFRGGNLPSPLSTNLPSSSSSRPALTSTNTFPLGLPQSSTTTDLMTRTPQALSYASARLADYTQREERLAQLRLASWAGSLQRSLRNERARYEALARGERLTWLRARLDECSQQDEGGGAIIPVQQRHGPRSQSSGSRSSAENNNINKSPSSSSLHSLPAIPHLDPSDPLGLLRWGDEMRHRGLRVLQIAGGVGLLGAVALWVVRGWYGSGYGYGYGGGGGWSGWSLWGWVDGEGWGYLGRWLGNGVAGEDR